MQRGTVLRMYTVADKVAEEQNDQDTRIGILFHLNVSYRMIFLKKGNRGADSLVR